MKQMIIRTILKAYRKDYWLGKMLGEDLFVKKFGYLNPVTKPKDLTLEELIFLTKTI